MIREYTGTAETKIEVYDFLRLQMGLTKRQIAQLKFREDGIRVNGVRRRVTWKLEPGDEVTVLLEEGKIGSHHLILTPGELDILYEDQDLCLVNKPAGVSTHPAGGHYQDTMANILMNYFHSKGESLRIRPIGRLDLETSGALCFAKNQAAAGRMTRQRDKGLMTKEYLALVTGHLQEKEGEIRIPLMKDPENPCHVLAVHEPSLIDPGECPPKDAITRYQVVEEFEDYSAIRVHILTGRMHQIRAHMADLGHPLLGDALYGGSRERIGRTALHARYLNFHQPFTGELIEVEAPLPEDFLQLVQMVQIGGRGIFASFS